jgi:hypothetical protein
MLPWIVAVIGRNPVRYARQGECQVFERPVRYARSPGTVADLQARFTRLDPRPPGFPAELAASVSTFVAHIRDARGVPMFGSAA